MSEELPSINDFIEDKSSLPSVETFTEGALPVQESVVEKKEDNIAEENIPQVIREQPDNTALIVSLIENVRNSIPEVKSYDQELYDIVKLIEQLKNDVEESKTEKTVLMESNGYDKDVLREELNDIRNSIPTVPEVKYYDEEIKELQESAKREFDYGEQYKKLTETVLDVRDRANVDHSWIRSTFSNIDDNFDSVTSSLATVKGKLEMEVSDILESMETKAFEDKVDRTNLNKKIDNTQKEFSEATEIITSNVVEFKDKFYKELKETSLRIWNLNKAYQKDDVKLKKKIDEQYVFLKEAVTAMMDSSDKKYTESVEKYEKFTQSFTELSEKVNSLPEIKNYDNKIQKVEHNVFSIRNLVDELGKKIDAKVYDLQADLQEGLLNIPPSVDNSDPLTPLDQLETTIEGLSKNYRLFVNRVQEQLATLGGGGAVWLWDLDDVNIGVPDGSGYPPIPEGTLLIYDASANNWVGIASTDLSPTLTLDDVLQNGNISGYGMSVGVVTATDMFVSGNVNIGGTLTYEDVKNVDAIGLITARSGIDVTGGSVDIQSGNLNVSGISTFDGRITVKSDRIFFSGGSQLIRLSDNKGSALKIENQDGSSQDFLDFKTSNSGPQLIFGAPNQVNNTITVGADDTGHDVIFYGDTSGSYLQWDQSADALQLLGNASLEVAGVSTLGVTSVTDLTARNLDVTGIATFGTTSVVIDGNNDLINVGAALTLGNVEGVLSPSLVVSGVSTLGIVTGVTSLEVGTIYATDSRITGNGGLDVTGVVTATGGGRFQGGLGVGNSIFHLGDTDSSINFPSNDVLTVGTAGTEMVRIMATGRLAIGDTTSDAMVTIFGDDGDGGSGDANGQLVLKDKARFNKAPNAGVVFQGRYASGGLSTIFGAITAFKENAADGDASGALRLVTKPNTGTPAERMRITSDGYVGINSSAPTSRLTVDGDASISGVVTATAFHGDGSNLTGLANTDRITAESLVVLGVSTLTTLNVSGNLSIGGTLTYEDVNNVDSVGIVTAGKGVRVTSGGLVVSGVSTVGTLGVGGDLTLDNVGISSIISSAEAFVDNDTSLMTAAAIKDLIPSGFSGTQGQFLQHTGSGVVGVSSVGIATFINDHHQGYYRYTTDYYTAGVANTVQTLPADTFVLVQPQVRTNKTKYMPQKMLNVNNNDPWVGTGATIGTGQTEFSLAGLDEGSSVIVRIASQFNPDVDNTNIDFALNFTTNPTTQSFGTTHFSVTREQALVCNEGAEQPYISETLINFYVGSSLSGLTTQTAGTFNVSARASDEGEFEMMALTINVVA